MASAVSQKVIPLQRQILILKEGTDEQQDYGQLMKNISACTSIADAVRTTLGPCGMDKLIAGSNGNVTISNDGATILKLLDIVHPAGRVLVDIACSQDSEIGDGTTSVTIFAAELLERAKFLLESKVPARIIVSGYRAAARMVTEKINEFAVEIPMNDKEELKVMLRRCADTAMSSKVVQHYRDHFSKMVVDAVLSLEREELDEDFIGIKKVRGGAVQDSFLVDGVAFKKTFSYAGFEQQPKSFKDPRIISLNIELELKAEKDNAEVRVESINEYQCVVDAEWEIIYDKLSKIVDTGANIVLSRLPIGDLAMQYFADRGIFCAGRVPKEDLQRLLKAVGGTILTSVNKVDQSNLGSCGRFEERQIGAERYNIFEDCKNSKTCTLILRGGAKQFIEEVERSVHDSIMVVKRTLCYNTVVAGGGSVEMRLSKYMRDHARKLEGKELFVFNSFARALEIIPKQLCDNAGVDTTDVMNKLRYTHAQGGSWAGFNFAAGAVADNFKEFVWEPPCVKVNMINAATEAACIIISTDYTVCNPAKSGQQMVPGASGSMPQLGRAGMQVR